MADVMPYANPHAYNVLTLTAGAFNKTYGFGFNVDDSRIVITNSDGETLATWDADDIDGKNVTYAIDGEDFANIPVGANYVLFVTPTDDGREYQWEYGYVIRPQVQYASPPALSVQNVPLAFTYIPGTAVGSKWVKKGGVGNLKVWNNAGALPNALGMDIAFFIKAAALWYVPFATDSVKVVVQTINPGAGTSTVVLCSDSRMSTFLGVQFETGISNRLHIVQGTSPVTYVDLVTPVSHITANLNTYSIVYDDTAMTLSVYLGTSLTPLISWTDSSRIAPHGVGYTYGGVSFASSLISPGVEFASWSMKDN